MKALALLFTGSLLLQGADASKAKDLCAPPPGATAPTLPAKLLTGQGRIHFPITTTNPEAQAFFDQGVAQMHSFWAREAERSFLQAAALDPQAPMPYWGIAMVAAGDYRPGFQLDTGRRLFGATERKENRATKAAAKAVELNQLPGRATPLEKLYIASIAARRNLRSRQPEHEYVTGLRTLLHEYPHEVEAKSYLALQIMSGFVLPDKSPRAGSMEAVALLRELLIEAPEHPGVHHYVIHGFEGSQFAKDAWPSCERYSALVTNIPHALHMPGHIYSQTGKWSEAVASFAAAAANERGYMKADTIYGSGHHGHNVHYLSTSYSFRGETDQAVAVARELLAIKENPREQKSADEPYSAYSQGWFALLRALTQAERWDAILDGKTLPVAEKPRQQAWRHWAMGLAASAKGNSQLAQAEAKAMKESLAELKRRTKRDPAELHVAMKELEGHIALAKGKLDRGFRLLQSASAAERKLVYSEPPYYPRPVAEVVGHLALQHQRPALAESAFQQALIQYPADFWAQGGLQRARAALRPTADTGF